MSNDRECTPSETCAHGVSLTWPCMTCIRYGDADPRGPDHGRAALAGGATPHDEHERRAARFLTGSRDARDSDVEDLAALLDEAFDLGREAGQRMGQETVKPYACIGGMPGCTNTHEGDSGPCGSCVAAWNWGIVVAAQKLIEAEHAYRAERSPFGGHSERTRAKQHTRDHFLDELRKVVVAAGFAPGHRTEQGKDGKP